MKPLGKKDRLGTAENRAAGQERVAAPVTGLRTSDVPKKYPMPPSMLLRAAFDMTARRSPSSPKARFTATVYRDEQHLVNIS